MTVAVCADGCGRVVAGRGDRCGLTDCRMKYPNPLTDTSRWTLSPVPPLPGRPLKLISDKELIKLRRTSARDLLAKAGIADPGLTLDLGKVYGRQLDDVFCAWRNSAFDEARWRYADGRLNMRRLTSDYVIRRRVECFGADLGGAHEFAPRGPNQTYTLGQIGDYRRWFSCIPRPTDAEFIQFGIDKPGRHAPPIERALHNITAMFGALKTASPLV